MKACKILLAIAVLFAILVSNGCSDDSTSPEDIDPTEVNKAVAKRFLNEVWNQGDVSVIDEITVPNYVLHEGSEDIEGSEALKQYVTVYRTSIPDINFTIDEIFAENDKVVIRFTASGTQQGELLGIPPTNAHATITGNVIIKIVNGKMEETWTNKDDLGLLQQIGVIPPMGRSHYNWGTDSGVSGDPGSSMINKTTVGIMLEEVWGNKNLAVVDSMFANNYILHDPVLPADPQGPEGFKQYAQLMITGVPECCYTAPDYIVGEDRVAVRWTWGGTQLGELMGIPATGKEITITGITIHRFVDGKFVESYFSYDMLGALIQLGVVPPIGG